jgi:hypothetical protein
VSQLRVLLEGRTQISSSAEQSDTATLLAMKCQCCSTKPTMPHCACRAFTLGTTYIAEVDIVLPEDMPLKEAHGIGG